MLPAKSLTEQVTGLAIEGHRNTGPGSPETVHKQRETKIIHHLHNK